MTPAACFSDLSLAIDALMRQIEGAVALESPSDSELHALKAEFRERTWPFFRRGKLIRWAIDKPRGYAGDFEMLELIYDHRASNSSLGSLLDAYFMSMPGPRGVLVRHRFLAREIEKLLRARRPESATIVSIGCGAARELQLIAHERGFTDDRLLLIDQDAGALQHAADHLAPVCAEARIETRQENVLRHYLRPRLHDLTQVCTGEADFIYSVGVMDYIQDDGVEELVRLFARTLSPGGVLCIGNIDPCSTHQTFMDWVLDWPLHYRDQATLASYARALPDGQFAHEVTRGGTPTNNFLQVTRVR